MEVYSHLYAFLSVVKSTQYRLIFGVTYTNASTVVTLSYSLTGTDEAEIVWLNMKFLYAPTESFFLNLQLKNIITNRNCAQTSGIQLG